MQALCDGYHLSQPLAHFLVLGAYGVISRLGHFSLEDITSRSCCVHNALIVYCDRSMPLHGNSSSTLVLANSSSSANHNERELHVESRTMLPDIAMLRRRLRDQCWSLYVTCLGLGHYEGAKALMLCIFGKSPSADQPLKFNKHMAEDFQSNHRFPESWEPAKELGILDMIRTSRTIRMAATRTEELDDGKQQDQTLVPDHVSQSSMVQKSIFTDCCLSELLFIIAPSRHGCSS